MMKVCFKENLEKELNNRNVILIGAGKRAETILKQYNLNVVYIVDSDECKKGTYLDAKEKKILVENWNYLNSNVKDDDVLMITPANFYSLRDKVVTSDLLKNLDCYIYSYVLTLQWDVDRIKESLVPFNLTKGITTKIPKIIHFFWFSGDPYPEKVQKCIDSWHKYCPDYEFKKWDLTNYQTDNNFANEALEKKCWAAASDFGRSDVVYKYGGVYLDTDVELVKPLDDLLYDEGFMCFESSAGVDPGSGFGAAKGNEIIGEIRNNYYKYHFTPTEKKEINVNIIEQFTDVLVKYGLIKNGKFQNLDGFIVYPPLVFSPYSYQTGILSCYEKTYGIHHWVSAWISKEHMEEMNIRKKIMQENITVDILKNYVNKIGK